MLVLVCKESSVSFNKIQNNWISGLVKHTIGSRVKMPCAMAKKDLCMADNR